METIKCDKCGLENLASALGCAKCGTPLLFPSEATDQTGSNQWSDLRGEDYENYDRHFISYESEKNAYLKRREKKKGLAYWSIALGVAGMPIVWILAGAFLHWAYDRQFGLFELVGSVVVMMLLLLGGLGLGILAYRRGMQDGKHYAPRRFAIPGIAVSGVGLFLFPLAVSLAVPSFLSARRAANEEAAIMKIKRIAAAQQIYMKSVIEGQCGDIEAMPGLTLLDLESARPESGGYKFYISRLPEGGCEIHGVPSSTSEGDHSFYYSTEDNQLRSGLRHGQQSGKQDPLIGKPTSVAQTKSAVDRGR